MIRFEDSVTIECTPQEVFDFLCDLEQAPLWQSGVISSTKTTDGPIRVGTTFSEQVKMLGRRVEAICTVIAMRSPEYVEFDATGGSVAYRGRFELRPASNGTRLVARVGVQPLGLWRLLQPLMAGEIRRATAQEMANIRRVLEERPRPSEESASRPMTP